MLRKVVIEEWLAVSSVSLEKTVIASLFHSGLHSVSIYFVEKTMAYVILGNDSICRFFDNKKTKKNL